MKNIAMNELNRILREYELSEIFFGSQGFLIYVPEDLEKEQLGYSVHPDGSDLTGSKTGDWQKEWVVFGRETTLGEPFFVDTAQESLPVYTAMHGMGSWEPSQVSPGLSGFLSSLAHLKQVSPVGYSRIDPDETTITNRDELEALQQKLNELNNEEYFWSEFIERHLEWLDESGS